MRTLVAIGEYRLNFHHGSQWVHPEMWNILKRLTVQRNRGKVRTRGPTLHTCTVLLMPDSLSFVWGHLVPYAKFPILRFSNASPLSLSQFF